MTCAVAHGPRGVWVPMDSRQSRALETMVDIPGAQTSALPLPSWACSNLRPLGSALGCFGVFLPGVLVQALEHWLILATGLPGDSQGQSRGLHRASQ